MRHIFIFTLFLTFSLQISAQNLRQIKWVELSKKNGAIVYTPESYTHDSGLIPIRFVGVINHNIYKVLSVLTDHSRKHFWVPRLKYAKVLERPTKQNSIAYYLYETPWPIANRDFIIQNVSTFDPKTDTVNTEIRSIDHKDDPSDGSPVRAKTLDGYSIIRSIDENHTQVEMAFLNDPGGNIPVFIINIIQKSWPTNFLRDINKELEREDIKILPLFEERYKAMKKLSL